jgi:hypothetical protein
MHDRELVIDTLRVIIKPLNDDCMVLAWIPRSTVMVICEGRAETALFSNVIRLYFPTALLQNFILLLQANTRTWGVE